MKKILLLVITALSIGGYFWFQNDPVISPQSMTREPTTAPVIATGNTRTSVFVPYWSIPSSTAFPPDATLIYFGVTPGTPGVNHDENGYNELETFVTEAGSSKTYLALRMLDSKQNFAILESETRQQTLIAETIRLAQENGFDGIVLDLEVSALPFASLLEQISAFNKRFYTSAKDADLHYAVALYGDTFFRIRPFDVDAIAGNSDEVMLMAYDFHKSRGNPGPNFPLGGKEKYGYDYSRLIDQFSDAVPPQKLTVIFGFFGYDWLVDAKQNMMEHGDPLSYNQIAERFLNECSYTDCTVSRDAASAESYVSYVDDAGKKHIVWFEDRESVAKKQEFLQTKGISSFSYWAHSYY